jgi:cell division protein FtsB
LYFPAKRAILARPDVPTPTRSDPAGAQPRRRGRRLLQYALILVASVLIVDALVGEKGLLELLEARREYRALEASVARMRAENARLREESRRLREDPAAIEDLARRELGLIKPGEKLFIVRDVPAVDPRRPD